jgi:ABC-type transport system substrate-binding protein
MIHAIPGRSARLAHRMAGVLAFAAVAALLVATSAAAADPAKVLRIASSDVTSLDPQQGTDLYSTNVAKHIFEALYQFDYLASPAKVIPNTAAGMPVVSADGRTWIIRLQRGILFTDDPAFHGRPRELVGAD